MAKERGSAAMVLLFVLVLVFDQATKYLALERLVLNEPRPVIQNLFNLTLVYNPGAAFGMFGSWSDTSRWIALTVVSIVALLVVVWFLVHEAKGDRSSQLALTAILAGAVGNVIDRVRFDYVVDFLDFYWGTYHWPAFNIADAAICLGVATLLIQAVFGKKPVAELSEGATGKERLN